MIKNKNVIGIKDNLGNCDVQNVKKCEICLKGKQCRVPCKNKKSMRRKKLELIHSDVCGPINVTSLGGKRYFITFTDDFSRWTEVYFMKQKSEAFKYFEIFKAKLETMTGEKIKILRTDNGSEYVNDNFTYFLKQFGIKHETTDIYTPQQNGVSERKNRTLLDMTRCLLFQSNLPKFLWCEALSTSNYIRNRCISESIQNNIPYSLWYGRNPNISYLKSFGSLTYVLNKSPNKKKLDERSAPYYLIGYDENSKTYRLYNKTTRKVIKSKDIVVVSECGIEQKNQVIANNTNNYDNKIEEEKNLYEDKDQDDDVIQEEDKSEEISKDVECTENKKIFQKEDEDNKQHLKNNGNTNDVNDEDTIKRYKGRPKLIRTGLRGRPKKEYNRINSNTDGVEMDFDNNSNEVYHKKDFNLIKQNEFEDQINNEVQKNLSTDSENDEVFFDLIATL
jgi:hypothetical protein